MLWYNDVLMERYRPKDKTFIVLDVLTFFWGHFSLFLWNRGQIFPLHLENYTIGCFSCWKLCPFLISDWCKGAFISVSLLALCRLMVGLYDFGGIFKLKWFYIYLGFSKLVSNRWNTLLKYWKVSSVCEATQERSSLKTFTTQLYRFKSTSQLTSRLLAISHYNNML